MRAEGAVRTGKFFELPLGNFGDHVIDSWFEGRRSLLRDVVGNFVKRHAHGETRGNFRDWEAGGFAGQRGAARNARIHFDYGHAAVFGIDGELDVRTAGLYAYFANDGRGGIAHALIFLVGKRLRWRDSDGIAGMHAHGIEIFNRADDHEVVAKIAHNLEFVFFPTEDGFLHESLVNGAHIQRVGNRVSKFFAIVGDRSACAAKRE